MRSSLPSVLTAALLLGAGAVLAQAPAKPGQQMAPAKSTSVATPVQGAAAPASGTPRPTAVSGTMPVTAPTASAAAAPRATVRPGARGPAPREKGIPGMKDGVTVINGEVVVTEFGTTRPVTAASEATGRKLTSGITVLPDGTFTRPDGTGGKMVEGDFLTLTGRFTTMREKTVADSARKAELKLKLQEAKHPKKKKGLFGR